MRKIEAEVRSFITKEKYDGIIKSLCDREGIRFVEMFNLLENQDLSDGLHPNTTGHKKIFIKMRGV